MASAGASGRSTFTPSCNRLLQKKWDDKRHKEHRERLNNIKPSVDNGRPREFMHIKQNVRKHKLEEERQRTIQRHNDKLLSRMHQIMSTTGRVDHRNLDWRPKKSLNYVKRANEMERITKENQRILQRIQQVRPQYSLHSMDSDYTTHKARTRSISLFPPIEGSSKQQGATSGVTHLPKHHSLPSEGIHLPRIESKSSRPDTHASEIKEEIEVDVDN